MASVPPLGHGGSVELAPLLVGRTRYLIENPEALLLSSPINPAIKTIAKMHIKKGEELSIFQLLAERGVIEFIDESSAFQGPNGAYLSGATRPKDYNEPYTA